MNDAGIIERLTVIGHGNPADGFRLLCVSAHVCSSCAEKWDDQDDCACTRDIRHAQTGGAT